MGCWIHSPLDGVDRLSLSARWGIVEGADDLIQSCGDRVLVWITVSLQALVIIGLGVYRPEPSGHGFDACSGPS